MIYMYTYNLNKIHQNLFKLENGNQTLTLGGENIIPHHYRVAGYENNCCTNVIIVIIVIIIIFLLLLFNFE